MSLPSVFFNKQEFIPMGNLYFNEDNTLKKVEISIVLGNNPDIDTTGIRKKIMLEFNCHDNKQGSYFFDETGVFKRFKYVLKQ